MNKKSNENLLDLYQENPLIRGLITLITLAKPEIAVLDSLLTTNLNKMKNHRIKVFFDELKEGEVELTSEIIESNEFLHCFSITANAFINSHREEKIRLFARLLKGYFLEHDFNKIDEYEEMLGIIDEMSCREIMILFKLYNIEKETNFIESDQNNDTTRKMRAWEIALPIIIKDFKIDNDELIAMFNRLFRTGCYVPTSGFWSETSGQGTTSSLFEKIVNLALNKKGLYDFT